MAIYPLGTQRVFYRAADWATGVSVTAKFRYPDLSEGSILELTEIGDGFYYVDHEFETEGPYIWIFYEEGVKMASDVIRIVDKFRGYVLHQGSVR